MSRRHRGRGLPLLLGVRRPGPDQARQRNTNTRGRWLAAEGRPEEEASLKPRGLRVAGSVRGLYEYPGCERLVLRLKRYPHLQGDPSGPSCTQGPRRPTSSTCTPTSGAPSRPSLPPSQVQHHRLQTFGPGESYTANLIDGSGSTRGTIGDSIFHCHLYPHFADGFWGPFRTHDVRGKRHGCPRLRPDPGRGERPQPGAPANNQGCSTPRSRTPATRASCQASPAGGRLQAPNSITEGGPTGAAPPPHRGRQAGADGRVRLHAR